MVGPEAEQGNSVHGADEWVGDHPSVLERDRGDRLAVDHREQHLAGERRGVIELGKL